MTDETDQKPPAMVTVLEQTYYDLRTQCSMQAEEIVWLKRVIDRLLDSRITEREDVRRGR